MKTTAKLMSIALVLIATGCVDRTRNEQVLHSIEGLQLVNSSGLAFRRTGGGYEGGRAARFGQVEIIGEIVSTNDSSLPPELAEQIAGNIRAELVKGGCEIRGSGRGGGIHYTPASDVRNANIERASVSYALNGAEGQVEVLVIERDYAPDARTRVVGQLLVMVNESR